MQIWIGDSIGRGPQDEVAGDEAYEVTDEVNCNGDDQPSKRCGRDHTHQQLVSGRCNDASYYPAPLVSAILKGIAPQAEERRRSIMAVQEGNDMLGNTKTSRSGSVGREHPFISFKNAWGHSSDYLPREQCPRTIS